MAKTAKAKAPGVPRARRAHRDDAEQRNRLILVGAVVAVILIAAGVIAYGWWATEIKPLGDTVLKVGDIEITLGHLERRLRQELPDDLTGRNPLVYPDSVLADLQREALLIEGSGALNIEVSEEEVTAEIRLRGGLAEDVEADVYAAEFARQIDESGLHVGEYRQMLRASLFEQKVREYYTFIAPANEAMVRGRWIVTDERGDIDAALLRLAAGEEFSEVATELSRDSVGATREGDLDWSPRGTFGFIPEDVEDYLFTAEAGVPSDVIDDEGIYYIVETVERDDNRAVDEVTRPRIAIRDMNEWLAELPNTIAVERNFDQEDAIKALEDVI